jgi:hypothetical protein
MCTSGSEMCYNAFVMYAEKHQIGWVSDINSNHYSFHPKVAKLHLSSETSVFSMEDILLNCYVYSLLSQYIVSNNEGYK